ncbi:hypothetical protein FLONG3_5756 [Fusarium longipes]|uniref:CCHC-type domain-containing protein n=1 Tax=Fusarium longipes TaxID=694270 RepID=A0A395SSS8_9HYPO|nr:hypothetical protein FLONG3_5756 [Fusarium longipes]
MTVIMADVDVDMDRDVPACTPDSSQAFTLDSIQEAIVPQLEGMLTRKMGNLAQQLVSDFKAEVIGGFSVQFEALEDHIDQIRPEFRSTRETRKTTPDVIKVLIPLEEAKAKFVGTTVTSVSMRDKLKEISGAPWQQVTEVKFYDVCKRNNNKACILIHVNTSKAEKHIRQHWHMAATALNLSHDCYPMPVQYIIHVRHYTNHSLVKNDDMRAVARVLESGYDGLRFKIVYNRLLGFTIKLDDALQICREPLVLNGMSFDCVPFDSRGNPLFCFWCWQPGHYMHACMVEKPRCGRCAGEHDLRECPSDKIRCPNCDGEHTAWDIRCTSIKSRIEHEKSAWHRRQGPDWAHLLSAASNEKTSEETTNSAESSASQEVFKGSTCSKSSKATTRVPSAPQASAPSSSQLKSTMAPSSSPPTSTPSPSSQEPKRSRGRPSAKDNLGRPESNQSSILMYTSSAPAKFNPVSSQDDLASSYGSDSDIDAAMDLMEIDSNASGLDTSESPESSAVMTPSETVHASDPSPGPSDIVSQNKDAAMQGVSSATHQTTTKAKMKSNTDKNEAKASGSANKTSNNHTDNKHRETIHEQDEQLRDDVIRRLLRFMIDNDGNDDHLRDGMIRRFARFMATEDNAGNNNRRTDSGKSNTNNNGNKTRKNVNKNSDTNSNKNTNKTANNTTNKTSNGNANNNATKNNKRGGNRNSTKNGSSTKKTKDVNQQRSASGTDGDAVKTGPDQSCDTIGGSTDLGLEVNSASLSSHQSLKGSTSEMTPNTDHPAAAIITTESADRSGSSKSNATSGQTNLATPKAKRMAIVRSPDAGNNSGDKSPKTTPPPRPTKRLKQVTRDGQAGEL